LKILPLSDKQFCSEQQTGKVRIASPQAMVLYPAQLEGAAEERRVAAKK